MKNKILLTALMLTFCYVTSFATTRTVSNHVSGGSQYSSLETAYAASANGDTLIIEGTGIGTPYIFTVGWSKSLVVIGAGFNSDKQLFQKTAIDAGAGEDVSFNAGSDNSKFYGIYFVRARLLNTNNVIFEDCQFGGRFFFEEYFGQPSNNIVFRNCIFDEDNVESIILPAGISISVSLSNCILDNYLNGKNNANITLTIDHCLFLQNTMSNYTLTDVKNAFVTNCIFMNSDLTASGDTSCTFLNNLERTVSTLPSEGENIGNTDPMLVSYTLGALYSTAHDYDLQPGSAAQLAGSDGTDIGVHGGTSGFSESGEVLITPIVRELEINNVTVSPTGTLNVHIRATKPNNE